jgi:hypothetical protein
MKTAVEQLIDEFHEELKVANEIGNKDKIRIIKHLITIATSYLPMEKEQMIEFAKYTSVIDTEKSDMNKVIDFYLTLDGEEFVEETFKSE